MKTTIEQKERKEEQLSASGFPRPRTGGWGWGRSKQRRVILSKCHKTKMREMKLNAILSSQGGEKSLSREQLTNYQHIRQTTVSPALRSSNVRLRWAVRVSIMLQPLCTPQLQGAVLPGSTSGTHLSPSPTSFDSSLSCWLIFPHL